MIYFLSISLKIALDAQKDRLIETVLLSTYNICFGREIRIRILVYRPAKFLSGSMCLKYRLKVWLYNRGNSDQLASLEAT